MKKLISVALEPLIPEIRPTNMYIKSVNLVNFKLEKKINNIKIDKDE